MAGEKPAEIETERTRPSANNPKKSTSKPKSWQKRTTADSSLKSLQQQQAGANRSMYGKNTTKCSTGLQTLWASTSSRFMRIWIILSNTIFRSSGNWLGKSMTRNTNRCFDNYTWWEVRFYLLKLFSKRKKQKKKKAILKRRTSWKTKRKRNKSRRVVGQQNKLGEATFFAIMP